MSEAKHPTVLDKEGRSATIPGQVADPTRVVVELSDGRKLLVPRRSLTLDGDGNYQVPFSFDGLEEVAGEYLKSEDSLVVPVLREELELKRKVVDTAVVKVRKEIQERTQEILDEVTIEEFSVEHVPRNVLVDEAPPTYRNGEDIVIPLVEEVLVVEKRLLLREEIYIRKVRRTEPFEKSVVLLSEQVQVERIPLDET